MAQPAAILNLAVIANTKQANAALLGTDARLRATAATSVKTGAVMKKAFLGIGLAAAGAATALYKIGEAFDDASDTIRTKTGATGKELAKLEGSFKNVVKTVPADFNDVSTALSGLNQRLGLTGRPLEKLTRQVTQLSIITGTEVQENVESVTRLFGDWGVATDKQTETLDKLYRASQDTGISVSDLSRSMVQFGSPLRQLGIDFDHAAAMFGEFEQAGVNTQTLMPGLRFAIKAFSGGVAATTQDLKDWGVSLRDPQKALEQIMQMIKDAPNNLKANQIAFEVFGQRAGPDMAAAIREGHFAFDSLIKTMTSGDDTISKAERSTRDFNEEWTLFKNQVMVTLQPIATKFFEVIGDGMRMLRKLDLGPAIASLKEFWKNATIVRETFDKVAGAVKANLKGLAQFVRGAVKAISGILTLNFDRAWDGVKDIFSAGAKNMVAVFKAITAPFRVVVEKLADILKDVFGGAWDAVTGIVDKAVGNILESAHFLNDELNTAFKQTFKFTNQALEAFGAKPIQFTTGSQGGPGPQRGPSGHQEGGIIHAARGRMVPGRGSGDKVPAMLEPGEVVLNRKAVAAMGGARKANRINRLIPRFATGGVIEQALGPYSIPPIAYDPNHAGGNSHLHLDFFTQAQAIAYGKKMQGMGWNIGEYSGPYAGFGGITTQHQSPGHYDGTAFDANTAADETKAQVAAIARLLSGGGGAVGAAVESIKRVLLGGPDGALKSMGQAALDKVRSAANSYLTKAGGTTTSADGGVAGPPIKNLPKNLQRYNHQWPFDSADSIGAGPTRALAAWQGLPPWFWKIAIGESGFQPGAIGYDDGGTMGYGLYQMTTSFADAAVRAVTGGTDYDTMLNPVLNTMAAKVHLGNAASQTPNTPGFPWYGTSGLQAGGIVDGIQKFQGGGIVQSFAGGGTAKGYTGPWMNTLHPSHPPKGGGKPPTYQVAPPSIAMQIAALNIAAEDAAITGDVADDRAILDQRALILKAQITKVSNQLAKKNLPQAKRLKLMERLATLKGDLNSIASQQHDLYPIPDLGSGDQTPTDTAAQEAAAANLAAQEALAEAMKALTDEIAQQNALVNGALSSDYTQALAYIGDLLNGAIGGQMAPRLSTAGSGSVVRA